MTLYVMLGFIVKLRDIIELSDVRLIIELDDADRDPESIKETFIITEEVKRGLRSILERLDNQKGCGVFIKGNYGSGKSHFLSYLYLLLKNKSQVILKDYKNVKETNFHIIKAPLVRYPSSINLENVVLQHFNFRDKVLDREEVFEKLLGRQPTVIIIDELSEFLRSKPSPPQFYEDIRFLQFLGEFSQRHPLWIVASLQEWIEETGHISSSIFSRIKDRYPLRINLTSTHIEDIINQRLIIKKEGAEGVIKEVFDELRRFYPHMELSFTKFMKTYPLHPFTTRFLSGLTRVFSQHRGVLQFVQSEVLKRLDEPADSLITPEAIFDHFEDRIREIPEYSSFARVVYEFYRSNLPLIFNNARQREVAEAAIKILILTELSPLEKRKTAKEIAEILLKKISMITDRVNYDYIKNGILEPLVAHQMYIMREGETYFIDVSLDEGIKLKARIKSIRERFVDRSYLFNEISNLVSYPYLPLKEIKEPRRYKFNWQNSLRECIVVTLSEVTKNDVERFIEGVQKRVDCYFIILSPFKAHQILQLSNHRLMPSFLSLILFWQPRNFTEEEILFIEEYVAKSLLLNEFPVLKEELRRIEPFFRDTITKLYFEGKIFSLDSKEVINISEIGYLPIERLLGYLFDKPLKTIYPEHHKIMPRVDLYSSHYVHKLYTHFIKQGRLTIDEAEKRGLVQLLKGILEPLGLIAKRGSTYTLHITPDEEIISYTLELITNEQDLYKVRQILKRSRWGFTDDQIDLLLSSLIVSGYFIPFDKDGVTDLKEINQLNSGEIIKIKPGKAINPELLSAIPYGRFIWGDIEAVPNPVTLKLIWKEASQFIRKCRKLLDELHGMVDKYGEYSIFKLLKIDTPLLNKITIFVQSFPLNISVHEGVERFLLFLRENNELEKEISYIERLYKFFDEEFQLINKFYLYISHPALKETASKIKNISLKIQMNDLLSKIQEHLSKFGDFEEIRRSWSEFYDSYSLTYKDNHDRYYEAAVFNLKGQAENLQSMKTLKRIAHLVSSITFEKEWWEIQKKLEELPEKCNANLNQELFMNPLCRCGFQIGMEPPIVEIEIKSLCDDGIKNFLRTIQLPENREKIDSTIMGLALSGKKELSDKLLKLMSFNPEKTGISSIIPLLDYDTLQEIENSFKGRWRIRIILLEELIEKIKGRRFKYEQLKSLLSDWIGDDKESIIHVKSLLEKETIQEELSAYGVEGKKAYLEIINRGLSDDREGLTSVLENINIRNFETTKLIEILKSEKNNFMKKKIRNELFERFWSGETITFLSEIEEMMDLLIKALTLIRTEEKLKGIQRFTNLIAPLSLIIERLFYENVNEEIIDQRYLKRLSDIYEKLFRECERDYEGFEGIRSIEYVKERLSGNVIIMDGLRYDLWLSLREILYEEGWRIKEELFRIEPPSMTSNFLNKIGVKENGANSFNGRTYSILKMVEREPTKRNLKRFLKDRYDIRFFHFNFIDRRVHGSTLDLYPLYEIIKTEFKGGIVPILKAITPFYLLSDHGFTDTKELKERYRHGGKSLWEILLPLAEVKF